MNKLWRLKLIAFSLHLSFSALLIGSFMVLVTQIWFPDVLFRLENVWEGLRILIPVDAILGPVLTLILFVPGKKGLLGDLVIIAVIQVLALVMGSLTIYSQRPEVIAFAGDRFEIVTSLKFDRDNLSTELFNIENLPYPLFVYALPAQTEEEQSDFVINNVQYQQMSERYRPINEYQDIIRKKALKLSNFTASSPESTLALAEFNAKYKDQDVLLFLLEGSTSDANILILNREDLSHIGYLAVDPWTEYKP